MSKILTYGCQVPRANTEAQDDASVLFKMSLLSTGCILHCPKALFVSI